MHDLTEFDPFASSTSGNKEKKDNSTSYQQQEQSSSSWHRMVDDDPSWMLLLGVSSSCQAGATMIDYSSNGSNHYDTHPQQQKDDDEGIALLKEVFPDSSMEELMLLHRERLNMLSSSADKKILPLQAFDTNNNNNIKRSNNYIETLVTPIQSALGLRILKQKNLYLSSHHYEFTASSSSISCSAAVSNKPSPNIVPAATTPTFLSTTTTKATATTTTSIRVEMPKDFLRIPTQIALQLRNPITGRMEWKRVQDLQEQVVQTLSRAEEDKEKVWYYSEPTIVKREANDYIDFACVVSRQYPVGLGMAMCERDGTILVLSLVSMDGQRIFHKYEDDDFSSRRSNNDGRSNNSSSNNYNNKKSILSLIPQDESGPAQAAGVLIGDRILGVNGIAFNFNTQQQQQCAINGETNNTILKRAGEAIINASDPVVLHLRRYFGETPLTKTSPAEKLHQTTTTTVADFSPLQMLMTCGVDEGSRQREKHADIVIQEHMGLRCDDLLSDPQNGSNRHMYDPGTQQQPSLDESIQMSTTNTRNFRKTHTSIHPFAKALRQRDVLLDNRGEVQVTELVEEYTRRTRQWESKSLFCVNKETGKLEDLPDARDLHPSEASIVLPFEYVKAPMLRSYAPSTPSLSPANNYNHNNNINNAVGDRSSGIQIHQEDGQSRLLNTRPIEKSRGGRFLLSGAASLYPVFQKRSDLKTSAPLIYIPLPGVRKALSTRIVHYFLDGDKLAYTIWIYDTETGKEWYAPVRYFQDFVDLRMTMISLASCINPLPFPSLGWGAMLRGQARVSESSKNAICKQLEEFLRALCGILYTGPLCTGSSEASIYLQSFLCCDSCLVEDDNMKSVFSYTPSISSDSGSGMATQTVDDCRLKLVTRTQLKRSIQRYTFRLFLLPIVRHISDEFVKSTKHRAQNASQMIEVNLNVKKSLKEIALEDLQRVKEFLDEMQALIMDGCRHDFVSISCRRDFLILGFSDKGDDNARDSVLVEGLREQLEIELYVPIRSVISKQVVNGWKHDDMEMQFKIQALKTRSQSWFKIIKENQSVTEWDTVSRILSQGVGRSTLPCVKLRAIVDAAKEIVRLHAWEHPREGKNNVPGEENYPGQATCSLGADEFLPIFIFSVVRAELERPFALCTLLKTLCEPSRLIGEIGYYLASFEAAIEYLKEIDLSENSNSTPW